MGDGGSGNDPDHGRRIPTTLLGKMLRINVHVGDSDPEGYDVPADNPFLAAAGRAAGDLGVRVSEPVAVQLR